MFTRKRQATYFSVCSRHAGWLPIVMGHLLLAGCSTLPAMKLERQSPEALYTHACLQGSTEQALEGSVWLKIKSSEMSGQFPSTVEAQTSQRASAPTMKSATPATENVVLWINNLFGGTEAKISVTDGEYKVFDGDGHLKGQGKDYWSGIPVHWATGLFFGRIPCPTPRQQKQGLDLQIEEDTLVVRVKDSQEKFIFTFKNLKDGAQETPWPQTLRWEKLLIQGKHSIEFKFEDPDQKSLTPKKWEAKSKDGFIRVAWRDRQLLLKTSQ